MGSICVLSSMAVLLFLYLSITLLPSQMLTSISFTTQCCLSITAWTSCTAIAVVSSGINLDRIVLNLQHIPDNNLMSTPLPALFAIFIAEIMLPLPVKITLILQFLVTSTHLILSTLLYLQNNNIPRVESKLVSSK